MRVFAIALLAVTVAQPVDRYSGTWTADYNGTTYVRIVLSQVGDAPQGVMSIGKTVHVKPDGDIDLATEAPSTLTTMIDSYWNGAVLSFSVKDGDSVDRFELRMLDADTGELTPIFTERERQELANERIALPKSFRVTKGR